MKQQRAIGSERQTVNYELELAAQEDSNLARLLSYSSLMYPHMLFEDVSIHVMPYRNPSSEPAVEVQLDPDDRDSRRLIASALGGRLDVADAIKHLGRTAMARAILFGEAPYEIIQGTSRNSSGIRPFRLVTVPPCSIAEGKDGQFVTQIVPSGVAEQLGIASRVLIDRERLVIFKPPRRVRAELPKIFDRLAALSGAPLPDFVINGRAYGTRQVPFDVKRFGRSKDLAIASAALDIGWSGRSMRLYGEQRVTELYWWYREYRFERFLAELRDEFLISLNEALSRVGKICGFDARVRFAGYPTLSSLEDAERHLLAGDLSYEEIAAIAKMSKT